MRFVRLVSPHNTLQRWTPRAGLRLEIDLIIPSERCVAPDNPDAVDALT
jgi:hypothetical protein